MNTTGTADRRTVIRHGIVAFVTGATIMILLHEASHAVAGAALGYGVVQLPFTVSYAPGPTAADAALTAIAGPLFSIASGLVLYAVDRVVRSSSGRTGAWSGCGRCSRVCRRVSATS